MINKRLIVVALRTNPILTMDVVLMLKLSIGLTILVDGQLALLVGKVEVQCIQRMVIVDQKLGGVTQWK